MTLKLLMDISLLLRDRKFESIVSVGFDHVNSELALILTVFVDDFFLKFSVRSRLVYL